MAPGPLVVLAGQTASGKSAMAMQLAEKFGGEIICADSRTIYKDMDIGTAKPTRAEQGKIKHHLLDVVNPDQRFNASQFKTLANRAIDDIGSRGKLPLLVGGTGLYISSVVYDFGFDDKADNKLRGNCLLLGLRLDKDELKKRINSRVDAMIESQGLEAEVQGLKERYGFDAPGLNAICYKEWQAYFAGEQTLPELKQKLYTNNWQYARRQNTWFKRDPNIHWITSVEEASVKTQQFLIQ